MFKGRNVAALFVMLFGVTSMFFATGPAFGVPPSFDYSSDQYKNAATSDNCTTLASWVANQKDATFGKPVTNVTAQWRTVASSGATFCQVTGWIWPEIKFQVTMPTMWNERYQMNGGGGWDGSLNAPGSPNADGYATSSANGGYMSANWPSSCGSFGLKEPYFTNYWNNPTATYPKAASGGYYDKGADPDPYVAKGNPNACQKVIDFGYRHLYETPVIAKKIVAHYYQKDPVRSYYSGGSCGGKEGQISAQKFPELYDGFFIGYPLGGHLAVTFRGTWDTFWGAGLAKSVTGGGNVYSKYKAALHYKTVYNKCDGVDGLVDGMIDDPRKCKFDALTDLPACTADEEAAEAAGNYSSTCFTLAQRQALKEIYAGPHNSQGQAWYPGQPLSAEYVTRSGSQGFGSAINDGMAPCMFANIALDPPQGPNFVTANMNWDTDPIAMQASQCTQTYDDSTPTKTVNIHDTLDGITISPHPDFNMGGYGAVYAKGAKIVQTHGWSDSLVTALAASAELYETTLQKMGVAQTKSFWKLYLVPGAGHGGGGLSTWPSNTQGFNAMVDWVENSIEPGTLVASRAANVDANFTNARTRPNCPYPEVARYSGTGSIDEAANFTCVPPIDMKVASGTINFKGNLLLVSTTITIPQGYNIADWNIGSVKLEGASATRVTCQGTSCQAVFNRSLLPATVVAGNSVPVTLTATFTHSGKVAQIQAIDYPKVVR